MIKFNKKQKGYSLPQMLTATAVGAVLTGVAATNYWSSVDNARVMIEMETIERISEAINIVLASDEGRTTYLTAAHRDLLQELIPETGSELLYSVRSTWKGAAADGNHQYALSLDIYPYYSPPPIKTLAAGLVNLADHNHVDPSLPAGHKYYINLDHGYPTEGALPSGVTGIRAQAGRTYFVALEWPTYEFYLYDFSSVSGDPFDYIRKIPGAIIDPSITTGFYTSTGGGRGGGVNQKGVRTISLLAKALDEKMDGADGNNKGTVRYNDSCESNAADIAATCNIHVYMVDKGFSYDESKASSGDDWYSDTFRSAVTKDIKSRVVTSGLQNSTVYLGKNL